MPVSPGICVVGTGAIATDHLRALDLMGITDRRWAVSRRQSTAEEFADAWRFEHAATDITPALEDPDVEVVLIASPSTVHAEQATLALQAGKHVVVEIPAALSLATTEALADLAGSVGRRLFVCHTMRSFPAIKEAKRRVASGELIVRQISGFFAIPRRSNQGWTSPRSWVDNLLWHHGCHQVDAALWVMDGRSIDRPVGHTGARHPEFGMVMDLSIGFVIADGPIVNQSLTYNAARVHWELRFIGDEDILTFDNGALLDDAGATIVPKHSIRDLLTQDSEMLEALAANAPSEYDIGSVIPAMRALHEVELFIESLR